MAYTDKLTKALLGGNLKTEPVTSTQPDRPKVHSNLSNSRPVDSSLANALMDGLMKKQEK